MDIADVFYTYNTFVSNRDYEANDQVPFKGTEGGGGECERSYLSGFMRRFC